MSKAKKILKTKTGGDNTIINTSINKDKEDNTIIEEKKEIVKKQKKKDEKLLEDKDNIKTSKKVDKKKSEKILQSKNEYKEDIDDNDNDDNDGNSNDKKNDDIVVEKKYVNNLHTGFINTVLTSSVLLHPRQMDNKIYINLKNNLKKQHEGKCYKTFGYIKNIYKIDNIQEELIDMENSECSQKYTLTFSCKIYRPIINRELIAKMDKITEKISTAINGPIKVIITPNRINDKRFYTGTSDMIIRIKPNAEILTQNHYVKIYVEGMTFADKDELIIIIGFLIDIATPEEITNYYDNGLIENNIIDDF